MTPVSSKAASAVVGGVAPAAAVLKLVSFNTYLISKHFNQNRETFPERRAAKIRQEFLLWHQPTSSSSSPVHRSDDASHRHRRPDLVFFQEVWGSGLIELTQSIDYDIPPFRRLLPHWWTNNVCSAVLPAALAEMVNSLHLLYWRQTGGLYDFSLPQLHCCYRKKHTFTKSRSKSLKGVEATLWDIPQWGENNSNHHHHRRRRRQLLVFNTHLDPWHVDNRNIQIQEIFDFVGETLSAIEKKNDEDTATIDWSNTAVLLVGDFNMKPDSDKYREIFLRSNEDLIDYFEGERQHTYAIENSWTCYPKDCGRIDYIFGLQRYGSTHEFLPLEVVSRDIRKEISCEESSDHYALEIELMPA